MTTTGLSERIDRGRLLARFAAAAAHPVTLAIAGAGCGKTVALEQYLGTLSGPVVRVDVRPADEGLLGFVRLLCEALSAAAPDARRGLADAYASATRATDCGRRLAHWLGRHMQDAGGVIAIDDLQYVLDEPSCVEFLTETIAVTPVRWRWILSSRSSAGLPIGSWLVYGDAAVPIDAHDLALTPTEAFDVAAASGAALEPGETEALLEATGGWITAFALALRAERPERDVVELARWTREHSDEYLARHVFGELSDAERELLLFAAALPEIDATVLEKAGFDRAGQMLATLCKSVTFLSVARADGPSLRRYRCHDLFRGFLERRLDGHEGEGTIRRRAAAALLACGRHIDALRLYAGAGATDETLVLLRLHGFDLNHLGYGDMLHFAIQSLPESVRETHPIALGLRAFRESALGKYPRAVELYRRALENARDDRELWLMLAARAALAEVNSASNPTAMLEEALADKSISPGRRGELLSLLAVACGRFGDFERLTPQLIDDIERLTFSVDVPSLRIAILHRAGNGAQLLGESKRATGLLEAALDLALSNGMLRTASIISTNASENAWTNAEELPTAIAYLRRAMEYATKAGDDYILRFAIGRYMDIVMHGGDDQLLRDLFAQYNALPGPPRPVDTDPPRGMLAAWEGLFEDAIRTMDGVLPILWNQEERMVTQLVCAVSAAACGDRKTCDGYLHAASLERESRRSPRPAFERTAAIVQSLSAVALALTGRAVAAGRLFDNEGTAKSPIAVAMANACEHVVRDLVSMAPPRLESEAFDALRAHGWGGFARILQAVLRRCGAAVSEGVTLTPAETAVLRGLADGRTTKEIASAQGCSVNTVRWHVRRTIEKFGCSGSDQAVRAARAQGLV